MGLTPASTGSGLHPEVRQSVCTAKAGRGLGDSLSLRPVRAREARCRAACHPHPMRQRGSCFLTPNLDSSLWGPLPHYRGALASLLPPSCPPPSRRVGTTLCTQLHVPESSFPTPGPSRGCGRRPGSPAPLAAVHPRRGVLRPGGGGRRFHDARANSTQTQCRPLASPPYCGVFPSRPHGCRELVATSQSD